MHADEYQQQALVTESKPDRAMLVRFLTVFNSGLLNTYLKHLIVISKNIDQLKRYIYYGKVPEDPSNVLNWAVKPFQPSSEIDVPPGSELSANDIIQLRLLHAVLGIGSEAGELAEAYGDGIVEEMDRTNILEEFGDLDWYNALGTDALLNNLSKVMQVNIQKLRTRYPDKFSQFDAVHRDLEAERQVLEEN